MRKTASSWVVGFALLLGACGAGAGVVLEHRSVFYAPHLVQYAARDGSFPVIIRGNPLGPADESADAAVAGLLRLPAWSAPTRFTPAGERGGLYFVLVFDPARRLADGRAACADPDSVARSTVAGETAVLGVFCQANEALSAALAIGPAPQGADDPAFRRLLGQVTGRVFAYYFPGRQRRFF